MSDPRLDVRLEHIGSIAPRELALLDAADPLRRALTPGTDEHEAMRWRVAKDHCVHEGVGKTCQQCVYEVDDFLAALREAL